MKKKLKVLFATPRSGSTPVAQVLSQYFAEHENVIYLNEFFNCSFVDAKINGNEISFEFLRHDLLHRKVTLFPEYRLQLFNQRYSWLRSANEKYFFKAFPHHLESDSADWIANNAEVICLKRKNQFEQYLSFMVSYCSGLWYEDKGLQIPKRSLRARPAAADLFYQHLDRYEAMKQKLKFDRELIFEDYERLGPAEFLKNSGFNLDFKCRVSDIVTKQNPGNKIDLFENPAQVEKWFYRRSESKSE